MDLFSDGLEGQKRFVRHDIGIPWGKNCRLGRTRPIHLQDSPHKAYASDSIDGWVSGLRKAFLNVLNQLPHHLVPTSFRLIGGLLQFDHNDDFF